jgi:hypothetical protein
MAETLAYHPLVISMTDMNGGMIVELFIIHRHTMIEVEAKALEVTAVHLGHVIVVLEDAAIAEHYR